jgi:hypothetical protein
LTRPEAAQPFFGLPVLMSRTDAEHLLAALAEAWEAQYGSLRRVDQDLRAMHKALFKPIARESTLRQAIGRAVRESVELDLPDALRIDVGGMHVITPEARATIEVLERALREQSGDSIDLSADAVALERVLLDTYRAWCRARLHNVVAMAAGEDVPLLPGPIGLVTMLLVDGATSRDAAVIQARGGEADRAERSVVAGAVAFARSIDEEASWDERHFSFYGGYALTEARRRMQAVVLEPPSRRPSPSGPPKRVYIQEGAAVSVTAFIARDLFRRGIGPAQIDQALDAALEEYGKWRGPERTRLARAQARRLLVSLVSTEERDSAEARVPP